MIVFLLSLYFSFVEDPGFYKEYPLNFYVGTTGNNHFIVQEEREIPISLNSFAPTSNQRAVLALRTLKWNVLYPNSKGKIILVGKYDSGQKSFVLVHWYLLSPFYERWIKNEEELPHEFAEKTRKHFVSSDFEPALDFDPVVFNRKKPKKY